MTQHVIQPAFLVLNLGATAEENFVLANYYLNQQMNLGLHYRWSWSLLPATLFGPLSGVFWPIHMGLMWEQNSKLTWPKLPIPTMYLKSDKPHHTKTMAGYDDTWTKQKKTMAPLPQQHLGPSQHHKKWRWNCTSYYLKDLLPTGCRAYAVHVVLPHVHSTMKPLPPIKVKKPSKIYYLVCFFTNTLGTLPPTEKYRNSPTISPMMTI